MIQRLNVLIERITSIINEFLPMRAAFLSFLFLIMPILEIIAFIIIGGEIGIILTLLIIALTAFFGIFLLRYQGLKIISKLKEAQSQKNIPSYAVIHGFMIIIAGICLIIPGFITDSVGIILFIPFVREAIWNLIKPHIHFSMFKNGSTQKKETKKPIIELDESEFSSVDKDSPWSKN